MATPNPVSSTPARDALPAPEHKPRFVRDMFDRIAPRYDLVNRLMTLGLDQRWRRQLLETLQVAPGEQLLDLATGTGDLAEMADACRARAVGLDFSRGMLAGARRRCPHLAFVQGDAALLPLPDASVDVVTCGFALRNFSDLRAVLAECARVLRPGGRLGILEVDAPRSRLLRAGHALHFQHLVPHLGALLSDAAAYRYLPESASYLPSDAELRELLQCVGFGSVRKARHLGGAAQRVTATRRS